MLHITANHGILLTLKAHFDIVGIPQSMVGNTTTDSSNPTHGAFALSTKHPSRPTGRLLASPPTVKEIEEVLSKIIQKITKYLERQKIIVKDNNDGGFQIPIPDEDTLSKLQATSVTYRFATGKSKGKKAIVLKSVTDTDHSTTKGLVAKNSGFSLHAGVATKAHERDKLEKTCRYIVTCPG